MRRIIPLVILASVVILGAGTADATLRVIGTATYDGLQYKLIWDDDDNGRSVVWLDFSNAPLSHEAQVAWASALNGAGVLTYDIDPAYSVRWEGGWRLPATVDRQLPVQTQSPAAGSKVQYGFSSELGHLYYAELNDLPWVDAEGTLIPNWGLHNTAPFDHLVRGFYWFDTTTSSGYAWIFNMDDGGENTSEEWGPGVDNMVAGLAIRNAAVTGADTRRGVALFDQGTDTVAVSGQLALAGAATYEARVLFTAAFGAGGLVFDEWTGGEEDKFLGVELNHLNAYSYHLSDEVMVAPVSVALNAWHHIAYVYDGSQERLYLDGRRIGARPAAGTIANGGGTGFVGAILRDVGVTKGLVGYLDTLRISSVARYFGSSFTAPSGDLSADSNTLLLYNFNEAPGSSTIADLSGNGHAGTPGSGFTGATAPVLMPDPLSGVGTATIDGVMTPAEWAGATRFDFPANLPAYLGGGTAPAALFVMNDATNLYLAVRVALPRSVYSSVGFDFDNDHDGRWPENGDDALVLNSSSKLYDDVRTNLPPCEPNSPPGWCGPSDTELGGTIDGHGAVTNDGAFSFFEISHPLDSGDVGHDFSLGPGSTVGFFLNLVLCGNGCADTHIPGALGHIVVASTANTNAGSGVQVALDAALPGGGSAPVSLTFDQVVVPGNTSAAASAGGPAPPNGFKLGNPPVYYELATTATFSGNVRVCIGWTEGQFANENHIKLFHHESSGWVDITDSSSRDTANNTLCGVTASFSPFALMEVKYPFTGFFTPVDGSRGVNVVKAGAAVPVKFGLGGDVGLDIFAPGYPRAELVQCDIGTPLGDVEATVTAGGSSLTYDPPTGQYVYVWKTKEAWAGSCRVLQVKFNDGELYTARFSMRK
jgi:hypothetical protein